MYKVDNIFTFEEFEEVMLEWESVRRQQDEINSVLRKLGCGSLIMPDCSYALEKTLERMFNDEEIMSNIEYFVYELDFGKNYVDGMIKDCDGNNIKMSTIRDLYDSLIKEMKENG